MLLNTFYNFLLSSYLRKFKDFSPKLLSLSEVRPVYKLCSQLGLIPTGLGSISPFFYVWLPGWLGLRSGAGRLPRAAPGVAADSQSGPTGVHLGSRALRSPEEREGCVLEGSRWDAEISIIGAWGTLPAALAGYTLEDPEDYKSPRPKADKKAGKLLGFRSCPSGWSTEALEAKEPHMGSPKPRYCLLPRQGQKCPRTGPAIFLLGYTQHKM